MVTCEILSKLTGIPYTVGGPYEVCSDESGTNRITIWNVDVLGDAPTFDQIETAALAVAKDNGILAATAACDAVLAPYGAEYGAYEMATWDQQYAEALAYTASPAADVPLLAAMCVARGISIAELAGKIIANRASWVALTGYVIGQRQRIVTQIEAATSVAEVEAVDMTISLPG
jgi:hypothetical protein